jgi:N-acetylglucosaminyldiphosphoundecaprenol N-acetyl-beta-D-mannosaminyltransferase
MSQQNAIPSGHPKTIPDAKFSVLGANILNVTMQRAAELIENTIQNRDDKTRAAFFVNAHTLNLAVSDQHYLAVLNSADLVFGDGTGVRWAAKLNGVSLLDNINGTDFIPFLFKNTADRDHSYYMLGGDDQTIAAASKFAKENYPGWKLAGSHHGFLHTHDENANAVKKINDAKPDVLLVGMGNPVQERWILLHQDQLHVPICFGIGGLFDFWAGNVSRAPEWLRHIGHEWLWRLYQQPREKINRYLIGNPLFLSRILVERFVNKKK